MKKQNFLSFHARDDDTSEEFSMIAGKVRSKKEHVFDDGKVKLLKFAAVYGANASGKSNLVKAIDFMKSTVESGLPSGCADLYCKIEEGNKKKPSDWKMRDDALNGDPIAKERYEKTLAKRREAYHAKKDE